MITTCPHCGANLADTPSPVRRAVDILEAVRCAYDLAPHEICGPSRVRHIAHARQVAMYLIRKHTSMSLERIGAMMGDRDHTTVISSVRRIEEWAETEHGRAELGSLALD